MLRNAFGVFSAALCFIPQLGYAELLCVQKETPTRRGEVAVAAAMKMVSNKCPKGYVKILDTATFKGESGVAGEPGASYADCVFRTFARQNTNTPAAKDAVKASASCNSGEYVESFQMTTTYTYSGDWNFNSGDTDMAGQTYQAPTDVRPNADILDTNGFKSGFNYEVGGMYSHNIPGRNQAILNLYNYSGSVTAAANVKLLCCTIGQ